MDTLGIVDSRSIAAGTALADSMLKAAAVTLVRASVVCAGRLLIVAAVAAAGQKHSCQCNGATQSKNSFHF